MRNDLLKTLLAIPSASRHEDAMVNFMRHYVSQLTEETDFSFNVDEHNNIYIRKGTLSENEKYPLVCAHTDTVHHIQNKTITETKGILRAYSNNGTQIGLGGDDICGVFIALELLNAFPKIKVALFSGEEISCYGSSRAEATFFEDVGYGIEFDSPGSNTMSYSNSGINNFADNGEFINKALPSLDRYGITEWQKHPYTDVRSLRARFGFACLNLAAGYFRMHSEEEYVVVADVQNSIFLGFDLIATLGRKAYMEPIKSPYTTKPLRHLSGCHFPDSTKYAAIETKSRI